MYIGVGVPVYITSERLSERGLNEEGDKATKQARLLAAALAQDQGEPDIYMPLCSQSRLLRERPIMSIRQLLDKTNELKRPRGSLVFSKRSCYETTQENTKQLTTNHNKMTSIYPVLHPQVICPFIFCHAE